MVNRKSKTYPEPFGGPQSLIGATNVPDLSGWKSRQNNEPPLLPGEQ